MTDATTSQPVAGVELVATTVDGYYAGSAFTDPQGETTISGLVAGTYFVHTADAAGYLSQIYDDVSCEFWGCDPSAGTPIAVAAGATAGDVDFALHTGGTISGTVTEGGDGRSDPDLKVGVWVDSGIIDSTYTSSAGHFSVAGLYPGTYYVLAQSSQYRDELYDDIPCQPDV